MFAVSITPQVRAGQLAAPILLAFSILIASPSLASEPPAPESDAVRQRRAAERGLAIVQRAAANYPDHRACFACHHQTLPMHAMVAAGRRGLAFDAELLRDQADFTHLSFAGRADDMREGHGIGGASFTVAYGLWTLALVDWQRDDTTDAMVHFLLVNQKEDGHWSVSSRRPPLEESKQSTTAMAAYFLRRYAAPEKEEQAAEAVEKALAWLRDSAIESQEDGNGLAWGLHVLGADEADVEQARQASIARQHADGGWSQIPEMESDAYATGQTLAVLASTGWDPSEEEYRRGMAFLLRTQESDGSWRVETRARPVQEFFDNGDPHGKHQFISIPATSWAVTALAVGLEGQR